MQFQSILMATLAVASISFAAPVLPESSILTKRAVTVQSDTGSKALTPAVTAIAHTKRQDVGGKADAAGAVADVVNKVVTLVQQSVDKDIARRQKFTQEVVAAVATSFPGKNVVMSNVGYTLTGTPDVLQKTSYKAKVGSNVSYDVLVFGTGHTFTLNGDGGFENWAFVPVSCKRDGKVLTC